MSVPLANRCAIITGGSRGLGQAIAQQFLKAGARILITGRDEKALREACAGMPGALGAVADVGDEGDCARVVKQAMDAWGRIDVLVNNAGVYGPMGAIEEVNWPQWVDAIRINLMGTVLMCRLVVPIMRKQKRGKIVNLSGGGATAPLPGISAYAASKAAVVRFTETLAEETREANIDVNAIAPGPLNTRMLDEVLKAGQDKVGKQFYERSLKQKNQGGTRLEIGADLAVYLASSASDGITGKLISAVWDDWAHLAEHKEELAKSDIYALRRIVPKDRGQTWGDKK